MFSLVSSQLSPVSWRLLLLFLTYECPFVSAVAYECTRTITTIYPDKGLISKAARCAGVFLVAKTNDIKYLGEWFYHNIND